MTLRRFVTRSARLPCERQTPRIRPALLGADARAAIGPLEVGRLAHRTQLEVRKVRRLGPDLYVHALMETPKPRETRG